MIYEGIETELQLYGLQDGKYLIGIDGYTLKRTNVINLFDKLIIDKRNIENNKYIDIGIDLTGNIFNKIFKKAEVSGYLLFQYPETLQLFPSQDYDEGIFGIHHQDCYFEKNRIAFSITGMFYLAFDDFDYYSKVYNYLLDTGKYVLQANESNLNTVKASGKDFEVVTTKSNGNIQKYLKIAEKKGFDKLFDFAKSNIHWIVGIIIVLIILSFISNLFRR